VRLDWVILCNAAEQAPHGLVYILGAGFDTVYRPRFPSHLNCALVIRLLADRGEAPRRHDLEVRCSDDDGRLVPTQPLVLPAGPFALPATAPEDVPEDWDVSMYVVANVRSLPLGRPGRYGFQVLLDGRQVGGIPFRAALRPAADA
jgi:hypothetical protein